MRQLSKIFFLFLTALLSACSTLSVPENTEVWTGRFSVLSQSASSAERHSGNFRFTVSPEKKTLLITESRGYEFNLQDPSENMGMVECT